MAFIQLSDENFRLRSRRLEEDITIGTIMDYQFRRSKKLVSNEEYFKAIDVERHVEFLNGLKDNATICQGTLKKVPRVVYDAPLEDNNNFSFGVQFINALGMPDEITTLQKVTAGYKGSWALYQLTRARDGLQTNYLENYEIYEYAKFARKFPEFDHVDIAWIHQYTDEEVDRHQSIIQRRYGEVCAALIEIEGRLATQPAFDDLAVGWSVGKRVARVIGEDVPFCHGGDALERLIQGQVFASDAAAVLAWGRGN